jgi:hypothetical protein
MTTAAPSPTPQPQQASPSPGPSQPKPATQTPAAQPQKLRLKGLDGDEEREYDPADVVGWAQRGRKVSQIMSKAEERSQAAAKKEAEVEARLAKFKSGDAQQIRAALREMGVDVRKVAEFEVQDYLQEKELSPEQKRIRELEAETAKHKETEAQAKKRQEEEALEAEVQRHTDELSNLFLSVAEVASLPRTSAQAAFPRIALMYQTAQAAGVELTPEIAAERLRAQLQSEHKALFYKKTEQGEALDLDALERWFTEEDWRTIRKRSVDRWRASKAQGAPVAPAQSAATPQPTKRGEAPKSFWRELDKRVK